MNTISYHTDITTEKHADMVSRCLQRFLADFIIQFDWVKNGCVLRLTGNREVSAIVSQSLLDQGINSHLIIVPIFNNSQL